MEPNLIICLIPAILVLFGIRKLRERTWGFCKNNTNLNNKIAIVTGANSGIGYEVAKELASRNAEVILACRNVDLAMTAIARIQRQLKRKLNMRAMELDLASLKSIQRFASNVQDQYPYIHILINNAGVAFPKNEVHLTENNFEIHLGVNHLGHFYLTTLLLGTLKKSVPTRIIIVSSSLHEKGEIDINQLDAIPQGKNLYANSKLANIYFCKELAKRTKSIGLCTYAVCPGWVYTSLFRHSIRWYHYIFVAPIAFFFMRSPKQGAQTITYCATEPGLENQTGLLYRNCTSYTSKIKLDDDIASELWDKSEYLINSRL